MKNILHINAKNDYLCEVISNINDGTNRIVLEIESDISLNPYLVIGSSPIKLSSEISYYVIQQSDLTLGGTFTFYIRDDAYTGNTFIINIPTKPAENWILRQLENFKYEFSANKNVPIETVSVNVGSTTTGNPGTSASVSNSGTETKVVLDFTIPRGKDGDTPQMMINADGHLIAIYD